MLVVLSPARNMRPTPFPGVVPQRPLFPTQTAQIVSALRAVGPMELESLLDTRPQRALELFDAYRAFSVDAPGTPALSTYDGAAFRNLGVCDFSEKDFTFAQQHLRILSALYGLLRPSDGILPHRLGLASPLRVGGADLLSLWGDRVYRALFSEGQLVLNLTSQEYARLYTPYVKPGEQIITCRFLLQYPDGARGTVSTVRAARGQVARFIVKNRITRPEDLKDFAWQGYRFLPGRSDPLTYVFIKPRNG